LKLIGVSRVAYKQYRTRRILSEIDDISMAKLAQILTILYDVITLDSHLALDSDGYMEVDQFLCLA
jgi:hypothetical protein